MQNLSDEMKADALEAQRFSRKHLVLELDFSENSILELETQCDCVDYAIKGGKSPANVDMLTRIWGAYLGEALIRATGSEWVEKAASGVRRLAVTGKDASEVFPQEAVRKRLTGTAADSILTFFRNARSQLQS